MRFVYRTEKKVFAIKRKVFLTEPIDQTGIEFLEHHGFDAVVGDGSASVGQALIDACRGYEAVLTRYGKFTREVIENCPQLKIISVHGVGVDGIDVDAATELGVQVTNSALGNQQSVAEFTIALMLSAAKRIIEYHTLTKAGHMAQARTLYGSEVRGKTLGIIGMGKIGSQVARIASIGLGMKVIAYNRHISHPQQSELGLLTPSMDEVVQNADFLSLHLPINSATYHLLDARRLHLMKPTAWLINAGRGQLVDEGELVSMLEKGEIAGAAVDVVESNLPNDDNPLLKLDNVLITPHTASFTKESLERSAYQSALGIVEFFEERSLTYPVNQPER